MSAPGYTVLHVGPPLPAAAWEAGEFGAFTVTAVATVDDARLYDAALFSAVDAAALRQLATRSDLLQAVSEIAVVVVSSAAETEPDATIALLRVGVQEVLALQDSRTLGCALRHAIERKRLERAARHAYATDLATGLPHRMQLIEHMTQLIALREREPAPMVLIVLRIEGLATAATRIGVEAANVLRRKVAVRLRSGLRAGDVVAAVGPDVFGVLLGHVEAPSHGERVASKLLRSLQQPFQVAGQACAVAVATGMALFPEHGKDADALLRRATLQATGAASVGREVFANRVECGPARAANDDDAT